MCKDTFCCPTCGRVAKTRFMWGPAPRCPCGAGTMFELPSRLAASRVGRIPRPKRRAWLTVGCPVRGKRRKARWRWHLGQRDMS